jgi:hypothetical protein
MLGLLDLVLCRCPITWCIVRETSHPLAARFP